MTSKFNRKTFVSCVWLVRVDTASSHNHNMFSRSYPPRTLLFRKFNSAIQCHHHAPPSRFLPKNTHTTIWPRPRQISNRAFVKKLFKDAYRDSPIMMTIFSVMYDLLLPPPWRCELLTCRTQVCRRRCHHIIRQLHIYNLCRSPVESLPGSCRLPPATR